MLGTFATYAYDFEANGIYYNITSKENKTVEVTSGIIDYFGDVIVPEKVTYSDTEYTVISIGVSAFRWCESLTSIELPASLKTIGESAFLWCKSLTSIELPASLKTIGNEAFYKCTSLKSIELPTSLTEIGESAFYGCTSLTSIDLPASVTSICGRAFKGCTSVDFITCERTTPPTIESSTFEDDNILAIYVPSKSVDAYKRANVWKEYYIQDIQTKIDGFNTEFKVDGIYYHVTSLENKTVEVVSGDVEYSGDVVIPKTVTNSGVDYSITSIGEYAFYKCFTLTNVNIQADIVSIPNRAFSDSWRLKSIKIPSTVTSIGEYAFYECESLESIELPESLTEIGESAFAYCTSLKDIEIPSSVISIGDEAFRNCGSLKNINIPASVTSIGDWAFLFSGLESIIISSPGTKIGEAFYECYYLKRAEIASAVIGPNAFYGCTALTDVVLKSSVSSIGDNAFYSCYSLESIDIPASVSYIGSGAFSGCWAMEDINVADDNMYYSSVDGVLYDKDKRTLMCYPGGLEGKFEIPNTVEKIGAWAFYQSAVSDIKIPASVSTIDLCAFYGSGLLTSVELPASVTMIDNLAFYHCESLETVKCNNPTPPTISYGTFDQSPIEVFYVPDGSVTAYKEADIWKDYNIQGYQNPSDLAPISGANDIIIANDLGEIPNGKAAISCYTLQGVRVPGVRTIDDVKSLTPGVYICRQGKKTTKVVVK
jgi:hypothetical protein